MSVEIDSLDVVILVKESKLILCGCVCIKEGNVGERWRWLFTLVHQSNSFVESAHKSQ